MVLGCMATAIAETGSISGNHQVLAHMGHHMQRPSLGLELVGSSVGKCAAGLHELEVASLAQHVCAPRGLLATLRGGAP